MSNEIQLSFATAEDCHYSARDEIADLLECAARIMRQHPNGERDDSVACRVADAGMLLRCMMEEPKSGWANVKDVEGIHRYTGRGARLSTKAPTPPWVTAANVVTPAST